MAFINDIHQTRQDADKAVADLAEIKVLLTQLAADIKYLVDFVKQATEPEVVGISVTEQPPTNH